MGLFDRFKQIVDDGYQQSPDFAKLSKVVCARCGCDLHLIDKKSIVTIGDKRYCDVCASILSHTQAEPVHECYICKKIFPQSSMETAFRVWVCKGCSSNYINAAMAIHANSSPIRRNTYALCGIMPTQPMKKPVPKTVCCVKCGLTMNNDGSIPHMGDKYYCRSCYDKLKEKYQLAKIDREEKQIKQELVNVLIAVRVKKLSSRTESENV